jgi:ABC-type nitrate/sulfonate/bicarbonate transport system permease component
VSGELTGGVTDTATTDTATDTVAGTTTGPQPRGRAGRTLGLRGLAQRWLVFVAAVVMWELISRAAGSPFFPPPTEIVTGAADLWFSGPAAQLGLADTVFEDILPSVGRLLLGWLLAGLIGIAVGIALGRSRQAMDYVGPMLAFARSMPPVMLLPFFLVIFGIGTVEQVALIIFSALWPVLLNAVDGARSVDQVKVDIVRSFRVSKTTWIMLVVLPAALPKIFAGLRVSLSLSLVLMVISEMVGATNGIGYQLVYAQRQFDFTPMWGWIVLLGVLGYGLNTLLLAAERRVLGWQQSRSSERLTATAGG